METVRKRIGGNVGENGNSRCVVIAGGDVSTGSDDGEYEMSVL